MKIDEAPELSVETEWVRQDAELRSGKCPNADTVSCSAANRLPADAAWEKLHSRAHRYCYIENTLADSVEVNIKQLRCVSVS